MDERVPLHSVLSRITAERIKSTLIELARIPSPLTELLEAEPQLRGFIDTMVEPRLKQMGITAIQRDPMGNLLATWGRAESGRSLMLVTNAMNQPAATMPNPYGGEVRAGAPYGLRGEVVLGKGLSEQKAPLAAILVALEAMSGSAVVPRGQLVFLCCVSGETGRHDAIASIIKATGIRADMAVLNGTGNRISLGNRGRVDVTVTVHGSPCHSSRPMDGCNAITGAIEVIRALTERVRLPPPHPQLGPAGLTINRIRSLPDTTHTVQDRCDIGVDRRLLPGEDPEPAVADIAAIAKTVDGARDPVSGKTWRVEVVKGAMMYPSLVHADSSVVRALGQASFAALGAAPETYYATNAFDQGFLNHIGVEACTYGPGEADFAHTDLDMASVEKTRDAAKVYAALMLQQVV
ncbi:MAG TPA: M20/M25/M40 family metallo-hydrolase [Xanthobacteraceae bacterium]|jgi:acetylornithine deacetylase/succinyl-diaminopimelate desuccinylase-like protein|nr:M20/M25/M40 family metallo-hydrolase [Xanthobacteraceae bacterium]